MTPAPASAFDRDVFLARPKPDIREDDTHWTFVYLMSCGEFTKVGIARDPKKRRAILQMTNPLPVKLERNYVFQNRAYAYIAERAAHAALDLYRGYGEWFNLPVEQARPIVREVVMATRTLRSLHRRADIAAGVPVKAYGF